MNSVQVKGVDKEYGLYEMVTEVKIKHKHVGLHLGS